jgi:hypothetical protein
MMRRCLPVFILLALAGASTASEDDLLLDVSPAAVFQTGGGVTNPDLGGTVGLTWGFNDRTDLGGYFQFDDIQLKGKSGTDQMYALGAQSWYTPMFGDIRPQTGARIGLAMDQSGSPSLDLAFQARALAQFTTAVRGFVGGIVGADLGQKRRSFVGLDLGLQLLL